MIDKRVKKQEEEEGPDAGGREEGRKGLNDKTPKEVQQQQQEKEVY